MYKVPANGQHMIGRAKNIQYILHKPDSDSTIYAYTLRFTIHKTIQNNFYVKSA
jgi:hypothetical protein